MIYFGEYMSSSSPSDSMQMAERDEEDKKLPMFTAKRLPSVVDRKLMFDFGPDPMASPFAGDSRTTADVTDDESDGEGEEDGGDDEDEDLEGVSIIHAYVHDQFLIY